MVVSLSLQRGYLAIQTPGTSDMIVRIGDEQNPQLSLTLHIQDQRVLRTLSDMNADYFTACVDEYIRC